MRLFKLLLILALAGVSIGLWLLYSVDGVPILAYHRVSDEDEIYSISPAEFERQMKYLQEHGYTAISLAEMYDAFAGKGSMPAKPVVITFDDGYKDNYLTALPIMEKYRMKATVFVIAGQVGEPAYLTWEQIREMQRRHTEIGSHTLSHVALSEVAAGEQEMEIRTSKAVLEENLKIPVEFLAYPFGKFMPAHFDMLRQAGYRGACTGLAGLNHAGGNSYALKRINIPRPRYGMAEFRLRLLRANIFFRFLQ
ncbi:MAG: polysaccharide deacetylase family protein [Negativicutes bacterium]|nr:polysaccharide deacetylase family protein [Negativicutes bacterium]